MIVIEFPKNSEEWLEFKRGRNGGSGMKDLYPKTLPDKAAVKAYLEELELDTTRPTPTKADPQKRADLSIEKMTEQLTAEQLGILRAKGSKKDEFYRLVAERIARPFTPNDYEDKFEEMFGYRKEGKITMIDRGHILEPEIIREFEKRNDVKVDNRSIVWQREDNPHSILTPDGPILVGDKYKRAVEVKALDSHRMIRAYDENRYPEEFFPQVVKYFINGDDLEVLHFVMGTDLIPSLPYLQFDIYRKDIETDIREYRAFEDEVLRQVNELAERLAF